MSYILYCNGTDVTNIIGDLSWSDDVDTLGAELEFTRPVAKDNKYIPDFSINCGDIVELYGDSGLLFKGIIITKDIDGLYSETFGCYDFLFYLNKNVIVKQVNGINASEVIKQLCSDFNISIGSIPELATKITGVYYNETVADIVEDVLEQVKNETGVIYFLEIDGGAVHLRKKGDLKVSGFYKPADNVGTFDVTKAINKDFTRTYSIEELKNKITVIQVNDEDNIYKLAEAEDSASISKYGLLQEVYKVDDEEVNRANVIASNLLNEYNKIAEEINITLIGADNIRAGRVLTFADEKTGITGDYFIISCSHKLTKQKIHTMDLSLEVV